MNPSTTLDRLLAAMLPKLSARDYDVLRAEVDKLRSDDCPPHGIERPEMTADEVAISNRLWGDKR